MKKILALIAILLVSISIYAIDTSLTFGIQNSTINLKQQGQFYIDITLIQPIGNLSIYGNYRNEMNLSRLQPIRFAPTQDYYTVGASYTFPFATVRLEHMCMHPVVSQSRWFGLQGGYTRFEITLGD